MPSLANHQSNQFVRFTVEDVIGIFNRPITVNEHNCWLWMGATDRRGYARYGGRLVHSILSVRFKREVPMGMEHCHTCPNKNCINPDHIYIGTHKQNMDDASVAGVMGQGHRRVTEEQIATVKRMMAEGHRPVDICNAIGVSQTWFQSFKSGRYKYAKPC